MSRSSNTRSRATPDDPHGVVLHIPPPSSPVSAVRRFGLAERLALALGELAADLVSEGRLALDSHDAPPVEPTP